MSKLEMLRDFVNQRLTAAAEEIFGQFERTIAEYEEELEIHRQQRKLPEPVRLRTADVQQLLVVRGDVLPFSVDQEDPEPPHIKEEQEELWSRQEGEQLEGLEEADIKFTFTSVPVKTEEDDEDKAQSSQLHQRQTEQMETGLDCGGPEPDRNLHPDTHLQPVSEDETSHSEPETDDSRDWKETQEPQSGLNSLKNSESPVSSSECAGSFDHKKHLQEETEIQTGEKPFSCSVCSKTFSRKYYLTTHMRLHSEEKCFSCPVCKVKSNCKSNLVKHMRIHTGEKPFSCSFCSKRFAEMGHLKQHLNIHTGEKPYSCSFCSARFAAQPNLKRHMVVHTGEKPFSCSLCGRRFAHNGDMRRHLLVHTGEKPFSCSVCGRSFTQKGTLKLHLLVHTGEKQFSCSVCDRRFARLANFKRHKCVGESSSNE